MRLAPRGRAPDCLFLLKSVRKKLSVLLSNVRDFGIIEVGRIRSRQHDVRTLPVRRVVGFENQPGLALDRGLVLRVVDNGRRLIERGNFSLQELRETVDEPGRGARLCRT